MHDTACIRVRLRRKPAMASVAESSPYSRHGWHAVVCRGKRSSLRWVSKPHGDGNGSAARWQCSHAYEPPCPGAARVTATPGRRGHQIRQPVLHMHACMHEHGGFRCVAAWGVQQDVSAPVPVMVPVRGGCGGLTDAPAVFGWIRGECPGGLTVWLRTLSRLWCPSESSTAHLAFQGYTRQSLHTAARLINPLFNRRW